MTRYSASRGILYQAPPTPGDDRTAESEAATDAHDDDLTAEATPADAEANADD